jgi:hypothetical protein
MKQPEPPEPWPDGIDVVVLAGPSRYFEGCFAPGAAGLISALEERGIAETTRTHLTVGRVRPDSSGTEWLDFRVLQRISTQRCDARWVARASRHVRSAAT